MSMFGKGGLMESIFGVNEEETKPPEKPTTLLEIVSAQEAKKQKAKDEKTIVMDANGRVQTVAEAKGTAEEYPASFFDPKVRIPTKGQ